MVQRGEHGVVGRLAAGSGAVGAVGAAVAVVATAAGRHRGRGEVVAVTPNLLDCSIS